MWNKSVAFLEINWAGSKFLSCPALRDTKSHLSLLWCFVVSQTNSTPWHPGVHMKCRTLVCFISLENKRCWHFFLQLQMISKERIIIKKYLFNSYIFTTIKRSSLILIIFYSLFSLSQIVRKSTNRSTKEVSGVFRII